MLVISSTCCLRCCADSEIADLDSSAIEATDSGLREEAIAEKKPGL